MLWHNVKPYLFFRDFWLIRLIFVGELNAAFSLGDGYRKSGYRIWLIRKSGFHGLRFFLLLTEMTGPNEQTNFRKLGKKIFKRGNRLPKIF